MKALKASKHLKKGWAVSLLFCLGFTPSLFASPAQADLTRQRMVYEVYAGGIHAVQAHVDVNYSVEGRYSLVVSAQTRGFLGSVAPWHGVFETHGWTEDDGRLMPELHKSTTTWRDEEEIKEYNYGRDGSFKSLIVKEHDKPTETKEPEDILTQQTTDLLTATLEVMEKVAQGEPCEDRSEVFDGKRRYATLFQPEGEEALETTRYNIYEGPARLCTIEVKPVAGDWHKKPRGWMSIQEQGRERGTMPTIWMGLLREGAPAVPVKIRVKTDYGTLFMHLAEYQNGDELVVAEKRQRD